MAKKGKQAGQTGAGQGSVLSGAGQKQAGRDALKGDMRKAAQDKARMMQVIEGMNRINGRAERDGRRRHGQHAV